jgi:hypothetical protein
MNELCITKHERWIIQVNENGSIPERQAGPKEFEPASDRAMGIGKEIVERTRHQLDGGELRPGER